MHEFSKPMKRALRELAAGVLDRAKGPNELLEELAGDDRN